MDNKQITVEVAYANPDKQTIIAIEVPEGTTVSEAIQLSNIIAEFPDIDLETAKTGVFGKMAKTDKVLRNKDRVEIYRKLIADPKESRRQQAEMQKKKKKALEEKSSH